MNLIAIACSLASLAATVSAYPAGILASNSDTCLDFGDASNYNGVFFGYYSGSSDIQGKIAVGGNADFLAGYSVGDQLQGASCNNFTTIVGGKLSWPSGRNYFGKIAVGDASSAVNLGVLEGCQVFQASANSAFNFDASKARLTALSTYVGSMGSTNISEAVISSSQGLTLNFNNNAIEVFQIPSADYFGTAVKSIDAVSGLQATSLLIFNVMGSSASIQNLNMEALANYNVLFNFQSATTIAINGVALRGTILAPLATIADATGVVYGSVYAQSMTGPCQINLKNLVCPVSVPATPVTPAATPVTVPAPPVAVAAVTPSAAATASVGVVVSAAATPVAAATIVSVPPAPVSVPPAPVSVPPPAPVSCPSVGVASVPVGCPAVATNTVVKCRAPAVAVVTPNCAQ